MYLKSITINGLFGLFDYSIDLNNDDRLVIVTGPNGYGKTTILNILYNLFNQRFFYFQELNFESIAVVFDDEQIVRLSKQPDKTEIYVELFDSNLERVEWFVYNSDTENVLIQNIRQYFPVRRVSQNEILLDRTGKPMSIRDFIDEHIDSLPAQIINLVPDVNPQISNRLNATNVYLIKAQRLLTKKSGTTDTSFINTIEKYAKELKNVIEQKQLEAYQVAQKLDSSFPKRLIERRDSIDESEFNIRFRSLNEKQKQLQQFGIATSEQGVMAYEQSSAKVLTVYLDDSEQKLAVYDSLLHQVELFVNILNEKRFAFKSIIINPKDGFHFRADNGQILNLNELSSGEQQEVVLLYELLFMTAPNTLVLIDEPEISLHVMWQKVFVSDLQKIANLKQITFLVSTHSPQIVNDKWDLTCDLFNLANNR
jgi:predicted ATP-binding protein involved in virulence